MASNWFFKKTQPRKGHWEMLLWFLLLKEFSSVINPGYESKFILFLSSKVQYCLFWCRVLNLHAVWRSFIITLREVWGGEKNGGDQFVFTFLEVKVTPGKMRKHLVHRFHLHIAPGSCGNNLVSLTKSYRSWGFHADCYHDKLKITSSKNVVYPGKLYDDCQMSENMFSSCVCSPGTIKT